MKKFAWLGMVFILVLMVAACSSENTTEEVEVAPENKPAVQQEEKPAPAPATEPVAAQEDVVYTDYQVKLLDGGQKPLEVIKAVRDALAYDLGKSKDIVDAAPAVVVESLAKADAEALKVTLEAAGATVELVGIDPETVGAAEEAETFEVVLVSGGEKLLDVVKAIRDHMDYDLGKSKDIVDNAPATIAQLPSQEEADALKAALEAVGATVEIN